MDGRRAHDEGLLEGLRLGTQLGRPGWQWDTLLGEAWDVDGGLLVESRLVVEQWDVAAQRKRWATSRRHLERV